VTETSVNTRGGLGVSTVSEAEVKELLVKLTKAIRAYQLYEENNPMYRGFVNGLRGGLIQILDQDERLTLKVEELRLVFEGSPVYVNENRAESLSFLLYKDGIREITLIKGLEEEEIERLLAVLHQARYAREDADDLLTLLWGAELQCFTFHYIDPLAEAVDLPEAGPGANPAQLEAARADEGTEEEEGGEPSAEAASDEEKKSLQEGFNPTLYALDPREMELLRRELQTESVRDLRQDVLNALLDRLEEPEHPERQTEILTVFRALLPAWLSRGALGSAARLLGELKQLEGRGGALDDQRRSEVGLLLDEVSSQAVIEELVFALESGSIAPTPRELDDFLVHLRASALAPLLRASETVMVKELQPVLRSAVGGIADRYRRTLVELIGSTDSLIAAGAARLAGSLQVTEAAPALQKLLRHPEATVRLAAIDAAVALRASTAAGGLQDALTDQDRSVRIAAARGLGKLRYRPASKTFREILTGKDIRAADITEKIAFFEGYGELGDPDAVTLLDKLLNGKGLLGRREPGELRAAAALALGKMRTPPAQASLQVAAKDEDPVVRSAVSRALRGGTD
jgi:HEAT repeat protein